MAVSHGESCAGRVGQIGEHRGPKDCDGETEKKEEGVFKMSSTNHFGELLSLATSF